jgi:hypothetical protein
MIKRPPGEEGLAPASNASLLDTAPPFNATAELSPTPLPSPALTLASTAAITTAPPRRLLLEKVALRGDRAREQELRVDVVVATGDEEDTPRYEGLKSEAAYEVSTPNRTGN